MPEERAAPAASVGVRIAAEIRSRIEEGRWPVGSVLPTEAELAGEFGVSRPSVREALSALHFVGYVEPRRRRGTVVLSAAPVPGAARHAQAAGSMAEVTELLEARLVLEPAVLSLAASDPDPAALDVAQEAVAGMALVTESEDILADTDHRLHALIADVCRNALLRDELKTLLARASGPVWRRTQAVAWRPEAGQGQGHGQGREWADDHGEIVTALERGDGRAAAEISRRHLLSAVRNAIECADMPASSRMRLRRLQTTQIC